MTRIFEMDLLRIQCLFTLLIQTSYLPWETLKGVCTAFIQHYPFQRAFESIRFDCGEITSGVNFINVFTHSFYKCRSKKRKKLLNLTVFVGLLESACIKAASKMLVKLAPDPKQILAWKQFNLSLVLVRECTMKKYREKFVMKKKDGLSMLQKNENISFQDFSINQSHSCLLKCNSGSSLFADFLTD